MLYSFFPHTISSIQFQSKSQCVISWSPSGKLTACWGEEDSRRLVLHFFLCYTGKSRDVIKTCTFNRGTQPTQRDSAGRVRNANISVPPFSSPH